MFQPPSSTPINGSSEEGRLKPSAMSSLLSTHCRRHLIQRTSLQHRSRWACSHWRLGSGRWRRRRRRRRWCWQGRGRWYEREWRWARRRGRRRSMRTCWWSRRASATSYGAEAVLDLRDLLRCWRTRRDLRVKVQRSLRSLPKTQQIPIRSGIHLRRSIFVIRLWRTTLSALLIKVLGFIQFRLRFV